MIQSTNSRKVGKSPSLHFIAPFVITLSFAVSLGAQEKSALEVEEVVVSDIRSERSEVSTPASIVIIGREEIEKSGAAHLTEVLRARGGVQVSDTFGDGTGASVSVRGFGETSNANTLVLVDGRKLNNNDIGDPDLNSIPLNDIERIEIVQGSAGTLFGDQAVGGVINIITRRPEKLRAEINARAGSYSRRGGHASLSQKLDNGVYYRLSAEGSETDNYRDHNESNLRSLFATAGYEYATGDVFVELQNVDERLETPGALFADEVAADRQQSVSNFANDFANTETNVQRVGIRQTITDWLSFEAEGTNREVESEFVLSGRTFAGTPSDQSRHLIGFTPRLIVAYPTRNGDLLLTVGHDLELFDYNLSTVFGNQDNEQKIRGTYFQAVVPVHRKLSLTIGARNAKVENDLSDDFTFPAGIEIDDSEFLTELGFAFRPNDAWRFFARRDESVRFAKVDEYLDPEPGTILRTQTGVSYELGAEWSNGGHNARVVAYRLDIDDEIAVVPGVGFFGFPANTNLPKTRRDGLILLVGAQVMDRLRILGDYSYVDARVEEGPVQGNRVPLVAEHILRLAGEYSPAPEWRLFGEIQYVSDKVFSGDFDRQLETLSGYTVVNLKGDYRYQNVTVEARVNNVFDEEYSEFGARATRGASEVPSFFPAPERNFWLSVRLDFD